MNPLAMLVAFTLAQQPPAPRERPQFRNAPLELRESELGPLPPVDFETPLFPIDSAPPEPAPPIGPIWMIDAVQPESIRWASSPLHPSNFNLHPSPPASV